MNLETLSDACGTPAEPCNKSYAVQARPRGLVVVVVVAVAVVVVVVVVLHCKRRTESECLTREAEHCVAMPQLFCDSCTVFSAPLDD